MRTIINSLLLFCLLSLSSIMSFAKVRLPSILGSHMVLQRNSKVLLWGWCNPGEKIKIQNSWNKLMDSTEGLNTAKWSLVISTPDAGGPCSLTIFASGDRESNAIVLDDILIGDVWVCGGQSNMEMSADWQSPIILEDVPTADYPNIHLFTVSKTTSNFPQEDCPGSWVVCTPETMRHFSAAGYYFGRRIYTQLHIPIGLISSNWGGTSAEVWTPKKEIESNTELKLASEKLIESRGWPKDPGLTYNSMIFPLTQYKITGAIWYQGEANVGTNSTYTHVLGTMIQSWRDSWKIDFPFYFVQIAPFEGYGSDNVNGALLREAQTKALAIKNTGMAVISDLVDDIKDIHPKNKRDVGIRLANLALKNTYGLNINAESPEFIGPVIKGKSIELSFIHAEQGLITKGGDATDFQIAGEDGKYYPAKAKVLRNKVIVTSSQVLEPKTVRFGFSNVSRPNLFSKEGLPVDLFRTDNFEK